MEAAARAHALECHLMNIAEERERLRALRARGEAPADGVAAAIDALFEAGFRERELRALFERALVMPVITAHPTESRRRCSLDHLTRIAALLDDAPRARPRARRRGARAARDRGFARAQADAARRGRDRARGVSALAARGDAAPVSHARGSARAAVRRRRGGCRRSCAGARGSAAIATATRT